MTSQERRLQRAKEMAERAGGACQRCGGPPQPGEPVEYDVTWDDREIWAEDDPAEEEETHCPDCGRQVVYEIRWDDADDVPPHVAEWIQQKREE